MSEISYREEAFLLRRRLRETEQSLAAALSRLESYGHFESASPGTGPSGDSL